MYLPIRYYKALEQAETLLKKKIFIIGINTNKMTSS